MATPLPVLCRFSPSVLISFSQIDMLLTDTPQVVETLYYGRHLLACGYQVMVVIGGGGSDTLFFKRTLVTTVQTLTQAVDVVVLVAAEFFDMVLAFTRRDLRWSTGYRRGQEHV